jgi:hypothetical protein
MNTKERLKAIWGLGYSEPTRMVHIDQKTGDVTSQPVNITKSLDHLEAMVLTFTPEPEVTVEF